MTKYSRGIQQQLLQEHRRRRRRSEKKQIVTLSFGSNCNAGTNLANGETFDILSLSYHLGAVGIQNMGNSRLHLNYVTHSNHDVV